MYIGILNLQKIIFQMLFINNILKLVRSKRRKNDARGLKKILKMLYFRPPHYIQAFKVIALKE